MSKVSTRKRNRITLALGAFSMLTFGGLYGMIAANAAVDQSTAAVATVNGTSQTTALVLTDLPTTVITATPPAAASDSNSSTATTTAVAAPVSTAAPTPAPTAAPTPAATTTHTTSRGS